MQIAVRQERQIWRERLLTGLLWCTAFAAVCTSAFLLDGKFLGWATWPFVVVTGVLVVAAATKPLGFRLRTSLLLGGVLAACGLALTRGFTPNAPVALAASCAMATLLLGRRWGIAAMLVTSALIAAVFLLNHWGVLPRAADWYHAFDVNNVRVATRLVVVFVACSGIIVFGTSHLLDRAERLLDERTEALTSLRREVAEREKLEVALQLQRESARRAGELELLGRMAAFAAHDFNNALQVIRGATDMVRSSSSGADVQDALELIDTAASQAAGTSAQLHSFGRQQPGRRSALDVREQLSRLARMLRHVLPANIALDIVTPTTATILADESSFQRSLVNLALNARDAMPEGGTLSFTLCEPGDVETESKSGAIIEVADTGQGIEPDLLEWIFEPFSTTKGDKGTGLGLASVRELVRADGGDVSVRSEVGRGTTFRVSWPLA